MDEGGIMGENTFCQKFFGAFFRQFLPSWSAQRMLKRCNTLVVRVVEKTSKDGVVSDAQLTTIISVGDMDDFHPICQYW